MNDNEAQLEHIELSIEAATEITKIADSLIRLEENPDFIKIIRQGYFVTEAAEMVKVRAMPGMDAPAIREAIDHTIIGIGNLQQHFHKIYKMAREATDAIESHKLARETILSEELEPEEYDDMGTEIVDTDEVIN